jgi:stearoyl-CoA desaturase (delta-9 desaturase)
MGISMQQTPINSGRDEMPVRSRDQGRRARLQRYIAATSVGIPTLGSGVAVYIAARRGVSGLEIGLLSAMYLITSVGVEAGLHRFFSHHSFRTGPVVTILLGVAGSMAVQGPVLFWAAIHRKHHVHTDKPGDPHSPRLHGTGPWNRLRGFGHAHLGWLFTIDDADWGRYVSDLLRDRLTFNLNRLYPLWVLLGLVLPTVAGGVIAGSWSGAALGFLWGGLVRIFLVDQVTWSVNSIAHMLGSHPHKTSCNSGNVALLSLLSVGGSWHNNHHAFPAAARTGHGFWQIDLSGRFIEILAVLGLAWDVRRSRR